METMRTHLRQLSFGVFLVIAAIIFAGCYEVHQGRYIAAKVPGWNRRDTSGSVFFRYPTQKTPDWFVQISGTQTGNLHLRIGSDAYDPSKIWILKMLSFSNDSIRIVFHDQKKEVVIASSGFQTPFGQTLDVGTSKDFTVIVPAFKIGDNLVPELSAHILWSNDKYRIWIEDWM